MPKTQFLSKPERKAIDKLKSSYGGTKKIAQAINEKRTYESRRKVADKKGFGKFVNEAEEFAKSFPKVDTFNKKNNIKVLRKGVATPRSRLCRATKAPLTARNGLPTKAQ